MGTTVHEPELEQEAIGTGVRAARVARKWKQFRLVKAIIDTADAAGVDVANPDSLMTYVSGWENGSRKVPRKYQLLLCDIFECEPSALGFGGDEAHADPTGGPGTAVAGRLDGMDLVLSAAADSAQLIQVHSASNLHPATLEQMDADVRGLAVDFVTGEPSGVTRRALSLRDAGVRFA